MSGHSVKVDVARQRIYLRLEGLLSDEQMTAAANEFIAAVMKVKPGFTSSTTSRSSRCCRSSARPR
jgi:hypothetical protein